MEMRAEPSRVARGLSLSTVRDKEGISHLVNLDQSRKCHTLDRFVSLISGLPGDNENQMQQSSTAQDHLEDLRDRLVDTARYLKGIAAVVEGLNKGTGDGLEIAIHAVEAVAEDLRQLSRESSEIGGMEDLQRPGSTDHGVGAGRTQ